MAVVPPGSFCISTPETMDINIKPTTNRKVWLRYIQANIFARSLILSYNRSEAKPAIYYGPSILAVPTFLKNSVN